MCISCRFLLFFHSFFFASFALPARPSNIATVNNKRSKLAVPYPTTLLPPPIPFYTPLVTAYTFGKAYNNENVGAKANEPIKIPEAGSAKNNTMGGLRGRAQKKKGKYCRIKVGLNLYSAFHAINT